MRVSRYLASNDTLPWIRKGSPCDTGCHRQSSHLGGFLLTIEIAMSTVTNMLVNGGMGITVEVARRNELHPLQ